jgi:hypothetical protein
VDNFDQIFNDLLVAYSRTGHNTHEIYFWIDVLEASRHKPALRDLLECAKMLYLMDDANVKT